MKLLSLHKYWIYSNKMKISFDEELKRIAKLETPLKEDFETSHQLYLADYGVFRAYWYSSLYIVIEAWPSLVKNSDHDITNLLNETYINHLRLFRNSTFHFQEEMYPEKASMVDQDDHFVQWIRTIHTKLGEYILKEVANQFPKEISDNIFEKVKNNTGTILGNNK